MPTTLGQSGPGSDGNEGVLRIPQSSNIIRTSPSDCLVSYPGHSLGCLTPLQRCSWRIQQTQLTGSNKTRTWKILNPDDQWIPFADIIELHRIKWGRENFKNWFKGYPDGPLEKGPLHATLRAWNRDVSYLPHWTVTVIQIQRRLVTITFSPVWSSDSM